VHVTDISGQLTVLCIIRAEPILLSEDGNTYTDAGTYSSVNGCHTEVLELTVEPATGSTRTESACDSYTWAADGNTYTASGTYSSVTGCNTDVLVLTITASTTNTSSATACDSYMW
jgi:hypothetical protein